MQGELFPVTAPQKRLDRLFFAVFPNIAAATRIDEAARWFQRNQHIRHKLLAAARQHISIHHVGDYKRLREKFVFAARQAGGSICLPAVEIMLEEIGSFEGRPHAPEELPHRPLVLRARSDGLHALFDRLGVALRRNGLPANTHFDPHLTLSYGPQMIPFQAISPICFVPGGLVLIHSEVGLSRYHVLGHWRLRRIS